jgi:hypothetical protein
VLVFLAATVQRFRWLGGPYFTRPFTINDHVWPTHFLSTDALILSQRAASIFAPGDEVTVVAPELAPKYDQTHWLTALGVLTEQRVVAPKLHTGNTEDLPDYVIAVRTPLDHPSFRLLMTFPEGYLYGRTP